MATSEEPSLFGAEEWDAAAGRPSLPPADSHRFRPLRAGLVNLWQYDEQELRFHQGRLILRGENGSGKSKALELLLPFLIDADLSPHRLDPFAGTARTMRWNLLEGDRHETRVGYAWLEFGRLDDGGPADGGSADDRGGIYLTLGAGLRASQRTSRVDSWYFVTTRRVGGGLDLLTGARQPLLKEQLRQALGEAGEVYAQGSDYRREVDRRLFQLGEDRFAALRHLMLQLRRPHLSEKLDPRSLSDLLTRSLPPIDEDLVGQLSQGFERLEHDQAELRRVEAAVVSVERFHGVYRDYCRGLARVRAAELRHGESRYHKTAAQVRETDAALEACGAEIERLARAERDTARAITETRGEISALEKSEAMQAARELDEREAHTAELEARAERDAGDLERARLAEDERRGEHEEAAAAAERARAAIAEPAAQARHAAEVVGLEAIHGVAAEGLAEDPQKARASVDGAIAERRRSAEELRRLRAERDAARERFERAEERRREADARARSAAERSRDARRELAAERERLDAALTAWADGLRELRLDAEKLEGLSALVADDELADGAFAHLLAEAASPRRRLLERRGFETEAELARLEEELAEVAAERRRVEAARELGPPPPPTRASEREGRPGAPLYLLCDFAPHLDEVERAGLEAALEAAGLLDAWVTPEGRLLEAGTLDTQLTLTPELEDGGEGTLAEVLIAEPGHGVEKGVIESLLRTITLGEGSEKNGHPHRLSLAGRWRLGPLAGEWRKGEAEHVGAAAREAARRRRLEALDAELETLARQIAELEERHQDLGRRLEQLDAEVASLPAADVLREALRRARSAAEDEGRRRAELTEAEVASGAARERLEEAAARLRAAAREAGLESFVDSLEGFLLGLGEYGASFAELARAHAEARLAADAAERAGRLLEEAARRHEEWRARERASRERAVHARAELETLRRSFGAEAREIVARHRAAQGRLAELEGQLAELRETSVAKREERARLEGQRQGRAEELARHDAEREHAAERLRRFGELELLPLVLEEPPAEDPAAWSQTFSLEVARAVERATSQLELTPEAVSRRTNRMHESYQELVQDLGGDFQPSLEDVEEVLVARVGHGRRDYAPPQLLAMLEEEAATRRGLLAEEERRLLESFLLNEVGDHLRRRLRDAQTLVADMNGELEKLKTASGLALRLAWGPDPEVEGDVREVVGLLRRDLDLLSDAEREKLQGFFRSRIDAARRQAEAVPWRDHLLEALDYRRWHRFRIQRQEPGERDWRELTRRGHAASSGGEKAVALHLPLFAAAAAHYASAAAMAPRLIVLDEAFAGIDQGMKGRCMGLLVAFDLDFMMTSHDEWGCYAELPGVATYQLYRDAGIGGVATIRFVWNGERLEDEAA